MVTSSGDCSCRISWKVTRRLTVDYGVRWDYATTQREEHGRLGQIDPTLANPNV